MPYCRVVLMLLAGSAVLLQSGCGAPEMNDAARQNAQRYYAHLQERRFQEIRAEASRPFLEFHPEQEWIRGQEEMLRKLGRIVSVEIVDSRLLSSPVLAAVAQGGTVEVIARVRYERGEQRERSVWWFKQRRTTLLDAREMEGAP